NRLRQARALQLAGAQCLYRAARLAQALPSKLPGLFNVALPFTGVVSQLLSGFELCDDPRQSLGERVVDLSRKALTLVQHACLAGLGYELRVQPYVLLQSSFQVRDHLLPLFLLL